MEKYRIDQYDSVYEYDVEARAYIYIGKLRGRTLEQFLIDIQEA